MTTTRSQSVLCTLYCRKQPYPADNLDQLTTYVGGLPRPTIFGGHHQTNENHRYSYWTAEPREVCRFAPPQSGPWSLLEKALQRYQLADPMSLEYPRGMWIGGWAGYFAYELGRYIESLPARAIDDLHLPWFELRFYDRFLAYDHDKQELWLWGVACDETEQQAQAKLDELEQWIQCAVSQPAAQVPADSAADVDVTQWQSTLTPPQYRQAVERILRYIHDGETYQINLSQRFSGPFEGDPLKLFLWQNRHNPAPYAAFLGGSDFAYVSASPELFLDLQQGFIRTKPIKGTRPHLSPSAPDADQQNQLFYRDLVESAKEQAELNMIVDLERNDLARLCIPGSRRVLQGRTIETYPTVYHAVATVGGQCRPEVRFVDILKAMFPGGSITGAPKIRSMEIIDELEPTTRGVYTGSIGWIGLNGDACLNIAIRTIIITQHRACVQAGGGIVADSDPDAEYHETLVKAQALLAGICACRS